MRWRHRFLATTKGAKATAVTGIVEADETFIRKSAKGSRRLVGRAPRKRGGKAKKGLSTEEHDCVLIVRDRSGATTDQMLPDLQARTFAAYLAPIVAKDAVLVSDGRDAYGAFAHAENILHIPIITSRGEHAYKGFHIVNAYTSRLKDWMRPFKGVTSWYLPSYLGWRRAIERLGENFTARALSSGRVSLRFNMRGEQSQANSATSKLMCTPRKMPARSNIEEDIIVFLNSSKSSGLLQREVSDDWGLLPLLGSKWPQSDPETPKCEAL